MAEEEGEEESFVGLEDENVVTSPNASSTASWGWSRYSGPRDPTPTTPSDLAELGEQESTSETTAPSAEDCLQSLTSPGSPS